LRRVPTAFLLRIPGSRLRACFTSNDEARTIFNFLRLRFKQLKELVELGKNNDPGTPVGGPSFSRAIICYGLIFAATGCSHFGGIELILILEDAHNGSSPLNTQVPVIEKHSAAVGHIIRMSFHHKFYIGLIF